MHYYYLAKWTWITGAESYWQAPEPALLEATVDLRSLPLAGQAGTGEGWLFASYRDVADPVDSVYLGTSLSGVLTTAQKDAIAQRLGLTERITSDALLDVLWEVLTVHADPTGERAVKPLMPTSRLDLELHLGGHSLVRAKRLRPNVDPEWPKVLAVLQEDYRRIRQQVLLGRLADGQHRRVLDFWQEQFGVSYRTFIPRDLPDERPLRHQTTISESFNKADSDILGPDLVWTELQGDADVVSNQCQFQNLGGVTLIRADSDLSSSDHYAQIVVNNWDIANASVGPVVRKDGTATVTLYDGLYRTNVSQYVIQKLVNNTSTDLQTFSDTRPGLPATLKLQVNGSTLKLFLSTTEKVSVTDTSITGNLRCGVREFQGSTASPKVSIDDFTAADVGAAPAGPPIGTLALMGAGR